MADSEPGLSEPVLCYPCYILQSKNGRGFIYSDLEDGSGKVVAILTDEDTMDRYRHERGWVDRGALRFDDAKQLLMKVCDIPAAITHIVIDPCGNPHRGLTLPMGAFIAKLSVEIMGF